MKVPPAVEGVGVRGSVPSLQINLHHPPQHEVQEGWQQLGTFRAPQVGESLGHFDRSAVFRQILRGVDTHTSKTARGE